MEIPLSLCDFLNHSIKLNTVWLSMEKSDASHCSQGLDLRSGKKVWTGIVEIWLVCLLTKHASVTWTINGARFELYQPPLHYKHWHMHHTNN